MQKILETQYPKKLETNPEEQKAESAQPMDPVSNALQNIDNMKYETISKFGWEQGNGQVKVYIMSGIDGVGKIPKDNISCEFTDKSFDLRIHDLNSKNYRLRVPELQARIEIAESKFKVKSNSVTLYLKKTKDESWTDVKPKQSLISKKPDTKKDEDPMSSIMGMMKDMYENGDEKTKRMIAESW